MRIANIHQFTENHRFYVFRDFTLGTMDYRMLSAIYQPMVGAFAVSLYTLLYQQISADQAGYSSIEQQRRLFLALDLEMSERGRKYFIEQSSRLEAIGLLQTCRKYIKDSEDYFYEYELVQPLSPLEFFENQHLTLLLRDKIGKHMVLQYRDTLFAAKPEELNGALNGSENLTVPFYDLFKLNTQVIDYDFEQSLMEPAAARQADRPESAEGRAHPAGVQSGLNDGFLYSDIINRFPKETSRNRAYVERLRFESEQLAAINYVARKYELSLQDTCRLLDEDGVFDEQGALRIDALQQRANLYLLQGKKRRDEQERFALKTAELHQPEELRDFEEKTVEASYYLEVPSMFQGQCDIHEYNMMLRNWPYTLVLKKFFPGSVPDTVMKLFEKIDLNYKLSEEVTNVLIHYLKAYNLSWNKPYIEQIVTDMLGKQVGTFEQAVQYIRERNVVKEKGGSKATSYSGRGKGKQKPRIPIVAPERGGQRVSEEELQEILQLAERLDSSKKRM